MCSGDSATVDAMLADDVVYTDGRGYNLRGHAECSAGARAFYKLEPEYRFDEEQASTRGDVVLLRGIAHARDPRFNGELLLRAKVRDGRICEWEVNRHNALPLAKLLSSDES